MQTNIEKKDMVYKRKQGEETDISKIDTNRLAVSLKALSGRCPHWVQALITDEKVTPYVASASALMGQLMIRSSSITHNKEVKEIVPALAAKNSVIIEISKPISILTPEYKRIVLKDVAGNVIPEKMDNGVIKSIMTNLVDGAFFSISSRRMENFQEVNIDLAEKIKFPMRQLGGGTLPSGKYSRMDFIKANIEECVKDEKHSLWLSELLPHGVTFDFSTGLFKFPKPVFQAASSVKMLFYIIDCHRKVRGTDKDARSLVSAGYYYGLSSRVLYSVGYVTHDIIHLAQMVGTKILEISAPDAIVNQYVLSSLVAVGFCIRVVGSTIFPERKTDSKGVFLESAGIFSYFPCDDVFLRWVPISEATPQVVNSSVTLPRDPSALVLRSFQVFKSDTAVPFCYQYLNDEMQDMQKYYPECSLVPTAHAHNGSVLVVRADLNDKNAPFDFKKYMKRVVVANVFKTYYVYARTRFYDKDEYAHPEKLILRNRLLPAENEIMALQEEKTVEVKFDRIFSVETSVRHVYSYVPPKLVQTKRDMELAIKLAKQELDNPSVSEENIKSRLAQLDIMESEYNVVTTTIQANDKKTSPPMETFSEQVEAIEMTTEDLSEDDDLFSKK
jgi:hypothetical protein